MSHGPTLFLKLDIDTYVGTREGVPNLLRLLDRQRARATFFISLGPDHSGKAITRIFRRKGFLAKMFRTRAPGMYGLKTMLYGTLLPAPLIGRRCAAELKAIPAAGHEVALHAWDHVGWHDGLDGMMPEQVRAEYARGWDAFTGIFGVPPRAVAAPGWTATPASLALHDERGLAYASDGRGNSPFRPDMGGQSFRTVQVPTTLPTLDEILGRDGVTRENFPARVLQRLRPDALNVFGGHGEAEGRGYQAGFSALLEGARAAGYRLLPLAEALERGGDVPRAVLLRQEIPGRAGLVAVQGASA
jgi:peptidoglycan/xylan/chitin deacetylase (PgdA/CDA1 family)